MFLFFWKKIRQTIFSNFLFLKTITSFCLKEKNLNQVIPLLKLKSIVSYKKIVNHIVTNSMLRPNAEFPSNYGISH